jgi:hypothetical protein
LGNFGTTSVNAINNAANGISTYPHAAGMRPTGVLFPNSRIKIKDLRDGTTNTALAGEHRLLQNCEGFWAGSPAALSATALVTNPSRMFGQIFCDATNDLNKGHFSLPNANNGPTPTAAVPAMFIPARQCTWPTELAIFSSVHEGGSHFLFGDGTVRFINESIESEGSIPSGSTMSQFQKIMHRADGQVLADF